MVEQRLAYNYAIIDETGWCYEICTTSRNCDGMEGYIPIPRYIDDYVEKYYNVADGKWYHDAEFLNEATELN